jgi:NADH dehydrogenase
MAINEAVAAAGEEASEDDPAGVIVGGAGLTGIQTAGEIAAYRTERDFPMDVTLVEQANEIFLGHDHEFQGSIRNELDDHDVEIRTGTVIGEVDDETIHTEDGEEIDYDVLV